jgi:hypothetical protein
VAVTRRSGRFHSFPSPVPRPSPALFSRPPIEVFFVCLCIRFGSMHDPVPMVRQSVKSVQLHPAWWAIDEVVARAGRHKDREPWLDAVLNGHKARLCLHLSLPGETDRLCTSSPISSPGLKLITTSWQFLAVYNTVRNVLFFSAAFSMLPT